MNGEKSGGENEREEREADGKAEQHFHSGVRRMIERVSVWGAECVTSKNDWLHPMIERPMIPCKRLQDTQVEREHHTLYGVRHSFLQPLCLSAVYV